MKKQCGSSEVVQLQTRRLLPKPTKYVNRTVRIGGRVVILCERCVHILSRGKSRGKYKLIGISEADCQECGRVYVGKTRW